MAFDRTFEIVNSQSQQLIIAIGDDILTYQPPTILVSLLPSLEEGSFKLVASLCYTDGIEYHCAPPNISKLFTRSQQVHSYSFLSSWKLLYKTGESKLKSMLLLLLLLVGCLNEVSKKQLSKLKQEKF